MATPSNKRLSNWNYFDYAARFSSLIMALGLLLLIIRGANQFVSHGFFIFDGHHFLGLILFFSGSATMISSLTAKFRQS